MIGESRMADQMVQVVYNAQHKVPWHWPVPAYLVTKGIATGLFMLLGLGLFTGAFSFSGPAFIGGGLIALVFTLLTTALLVYDLEHPTRFLRIVLRPQMKSWLVRGAFLLIGFSTVLGLWWVAEAAAALGWIDLSLAEAVRMPAFWVGVPLALGAAIYTAFLFGQAEGRDLWQSGLLPIHLIVQAFMGGAAALLVLASATAIDPAVSDLARTVFAVALVVDVLVILFGEVWMPHASEAAAQAAHKITHGTYRNLFWGGAMVIGHAIPLLLLFVQAPWAGAVAGLLALVGLYAYEHAYVMAPQEVPNS
jgi:formate-dependent nitrite reductase membrane component NrfD